MRRGYWGSHVSESRHEAPRFVEGRKRTNNGNDRSRSPAGMTTKKAQPLTAVPLRGAPFDFAQGRLPSAQNSDAHGHEDVAVFDVFVGVFGAHLAGGLGVLELEADFALNAGRAEEVDQVGAVEADY